MQFILKAVGPDGRIEQRELQAPDRATAVRQFEERGYSVLSARARRFRLLPWSTASSFPVMLVGHELLELLNSGLTLVESMDILAQKERRDDNRAVLERIAALLREGRRLSDAMEQLPQAFPALLVASVRAGERTGELAPSLSRYLAYASQLEAIRRRVVSASIYPLLLLSVGGLVSLFLLVYVVPRFSRIYEDRATDLPLFSKLLLAWGQAVQGNGLFVLLLVVGIVMVTIALFRTSRVRAALGNALWRLPAFGERMKVYQLARFYRTAGMLLQGGMPMVTALATSADLLHPVLRARLAAAGQAISEGRPVSQSMDANGLATPVALRMLAVGEKSGSMGEMMTRIAAFHDEELSRWIDWFTRLFEPLLMAAIGLVIGAIVILMYLPIFELAGNLQ